MSYFDHILQTVFGKSHTKFTPELRERLHRLWLSGFEWGNDMPHTCGGFNPTSQGPVGPENCDACRILGD